MARTRKEEIAGQRKQRLKWGDPKLRMSVDDATIERLRNEGKVPRWVKDDGKGRIQKLQQRGYEFVADDDVKVGEDGTGNTDLGSLVSRVTGTMKNGDPERSYLMATPIEFYQEDQSEKENINKMVDESIRRGEPGGPNQTSVADNDGSKTFIKPETRYQP